MKRRLFKLVLFILLGAVVNVAVACACVFLADPELPQELMDSELPPTEEEIAWWQGHAAHDFPDRPYFVAPKIDFGFQQVQFLATNYEGSDEQEWYLAQRAKAGWPMACVYGEQWVRDADMANLGTKNDSARYVGAVSFTQLGLTGADFSELRFLPFLPIAHAFLLNTILYAAVLLILWSSPFATRRLIRRKRGRCIKCGYDLRGHSGGGGCPECGWGREAEV